MPHRRRLYGKYRATVVGVTDPQMMGRLLVECPVVGNTAVWAVPCLPWFGDGGILALPDVGQLVWVEFEAGDPSYPIWSGAIVAAPIRAEPGMVILAKAGTQITLSDNPSQEVSITTQAGARIHVAANGIRIENGQGASVSLVGPSIILNEGALSIT